MAHRVLAEIHTRQESFDLAEQGHRASLELYEANMTALPNDMRRLNFAAWQACRLGEFLLLRQRIDEAVEYIVVGADRVVTSCSRSPDDAMQRQGVMTLVPWGCEELVKVNRLDAAQGIRRNAILLLQPVVEADPDNEALRQVLLQITDISFEQSPG